MKRILTVFAMSALLALPAVVGAQPTAIPPEAREETRLDPYGRQELGTPFGAEATRAEVREAQRALQAAGFYRGPIDGIFGPRTAAALREYQDVHGLRPTGRLDAPTRTALLGERPRERVMPGEREVRPAAPDTLLTRGEILVAQENLREFGFNPGPLDGLFDRQTQAAVREFQGTRGLPMTGLLDEATRKQLIPGREQAPGGEG